MDTNDHIVFRASLIALIVYLIIEWIFPCQ